MVDGRAGMHPLAVEWNRRLRELWTADIIAALNRIDPYASQGRLTPASLPPGVTRDAGDYNPAAVYRRGDIVTGSDGRDYLALVDGTTGLDPAVSPDEFRPIEGWNPDHDHGGGLEEGLPLAAANTHESVVLGPNPGAIHWSEAALLTLLGTIGTRYLDAVGGVDLTARAFLRFGAGSLSAEGPDGALYLPPVNSDGTDIYTLVPVLDGMGDPIVDADGNIIYVYEVFAGAVGPAGPTGPAGADGIALKYAANIGDGVLTTIVVNHALGEADVLVQVREVASNLVVYPDITITDSNNVTLDFAVAPATNTIRVVVLG